MSNKLSKILLICCLAVCIPLFISLFQLFFLNFGNFLGKKLCNFSKIPENCWSVLSGILLIVIGLLGT